MLEQVMVSDLQSWGAGGVVVLALILLFTGRLVPWRYINAMKDQYEDALQERDKTIRRVEKERDDWHAAATALRDQNGELLTNQDLTLTAWNSIKAYVAAKEHDL